MNISTFFTVSFKLYRIPAILNQVLIKMSNHKQNVDLIKHSMPSSRLNLMPIDKNYTVNTAKIKKKLTV